MGEEPLEKARRRRSNREDPSEKVYERSCRRRFNREGPSEKGRGRRAVRERHRRRSVGEGPPDKVRSSGRKVAGEWPESGSDTM